ncbi:MAG: hypothetical protein ABI164_09230, partial [Acidobacteriaceae bacterium]
MAITAETPVRDIAIELPTAIPSPEHFGIDCGCGGKHTLAEAGFGSVQRPVTRMMQAHDHTGYELRLLREITHNDLLPNDACTTYRVLYCALEDLERDTHRYIHLENNILFPGALSRA